MVSKDNFEALAIFFLSCVFVAGVLGAFTTKKIKLFYVQDVLGNYWVVIYLLN